MPEGTTRRSVGQASRPATGEDDPDRVLLQRLGAGDDGAFSDLWERHAPRLRALCRSLLGPEDAADALQEAWLKARNALPARALEIRNLGAWLATVTRRTCFDAIERAKRETGLAVRVARESGAVDDVPDEPPEDLLAARHRVEGLPRHLREPLVRHCEGESYREIAAQLGISEQAARQRACRARQQLGQAVGRPAARQVMWEIHARAAQVRVVSLPLGPEGTGSYRLHLGERLPRRPVRTETLRTYVADHPRGWKLRLELAHLLFATGAWPEAVAHYRAVLEQRPRRLDLWMRLGGIFRGLDGPARPGAPAVSASRFPLPASSDARHAYTRALHLAETRAAREHLRGWILVCEGAIDAALQAFHQAAALEPRNLAHWHALGFVSREAGRLAESARAFDRALVIDPDDIVALSGSHDALQQLGRNQEILARLSRVVALDPNDVPALKLLAVHRCCWGYLWGKEGERTRALARRAVRLAPDVSESWEALCNYHDSRGERDRSVACWRAYLDKCPGDARAWRLFGAELQALGRRAEEWAAFRRAAELAPDDFHCQAAFCQALAELGPRNGGVGMATGSGSRGPSLPHHAGEEARRAVADLLARFGDRWECHARAGFILAAWLDEADGGCHIARHGVELQPDLEASWRLYAETLWAAGRRGDAQIAFARAWDLSASPRIPRLTLDIARRWRELRDPVHDSSAVAPAKAEREWLQRALTDAEAWHAVSPSLSHLYRGQALAALGDLPGAVAAYRAALGIGLMSYEELAAAQEGVERLALASE